MTQCTVMGLRNEFTGTLMTFSRLKTARFILRFIGWKNAAGCLPRGGSPKTIAAQSSTNGPEPDGSGLKASKPTGSVFRRQLRESCKPLRVLESKGQTMKALTGLFERLDRQQSKSEIEEELRFHLDRLTEENCRQDLSWVEARGIAQTRFENLEQFRALC